MRRPPSYRLHKATGYAVVTLGGRDYYLGRHGTPESREQYRRLVAEWLAGGGVVRPPRGAVLAVAEVVQLYLAHARVDFTRDGRLSSQYDRAERALRHLLPLYGTTPVADFSPLRMKAVRQSMVDAGWSRLYINKSVTCIRACIAWAVSEELVEPQVLMGLDAVEPLQRGRTTAPEPVIVTPPDEAAVEAVLAIASPPIRAMIGVQMWSGARPGEVVQMRAVDIDMTGRAETLGGDVELGAGVWVYQPRRHKAQHRGRPRIIILGPQAQAYITPLLNRPPDAPLFSPREAVVYLRQRQRAARRTPVQPSQVDRAKRNPKRRPGIQYTVTAYSQWVRLACKRLGVAHWHPHQLRHLAATRLAKVYDEETARAILGHRHVEMTRRYVEADLRTAADAMRAHG